MHVFSSERIKKKNCDLRINVKVITLDPKSIKKKATEDTFYQLKVSIDLHLRTTGLNIFLTVVV